MLRLYFERRDIHDTDEIAAFPIGTGSYPARAVPGPGEIGLMRPKKYLH